MGPDVQERSGVWRLATPRGPAVCVASGRVVVSWRWWGNMILIQGRGLAAASLSAGWAGWLGTSGSNTDVYLYYYYEFRTKA
jgi:hypothetical protein